MMGNDMFRALDITGSALTAERTRMDIIAENLANANVTRMADGSGPYRRKEVVFAQELSRAMMLRSNDRGVGGVRVAGIVEDNAEFQKLHRPWHPDADADGNVLMPNVNAAHEMVNLLMASRSYEANLSSIKAFQEMMRLTLGIGSA